MGMRPNGLMAAAMVALAGCGSDGSSVPQAAGGDAGAGGIGGLPAAQLVRQDAMEASAFQALAGTDADLGAVMAKAAAAGFATVAAAGEVADSDGNVLRWGLLRHATGGERTAAQMCPAAGGCRSALIAIEGGAAVFTGADGQPAEPLLRAAPVLAKNLEGHDVSGKTTLATALLEAKDVVPAPAGTRRLIILSAFGGVFGLDLGPWKAAGDASGAFDQVVLRPYARPADVDDALLNGNVHDVVVWVGASVRESVGKAHKTVGMTVNRGVYGDETYPAARAKELLDRAPFGGPGTLILVGIESWGDGTSEESAQHALAHALPGAGERTVIGVRGSADTQTLLDAGGAALDALLAGKTLAEAVAAGTAKAGSATLQASRMLSAPDATLAGPLADLWAGQTAPNKAVVYATITNVCFRADGSSYSENESFARPFLPVTVRGAFLSGQKKDATTGVEADFTLAGVIERPATGGRIWLRLAGDLGPSVRGVVLQGRGSFLDKTDTANPSRLFFDGEADATEYTNAAGDRCVLKSPKLSTTTSQPSWLEVDG